MSLQNFCRKPLVKVAPETNITEACRLMEQNNVGSVVAEQDGKLCGILTDREYRAARRRRRKRSANDAGQRYYDARSDSHFCG